MDGLGRPTHPGTTLPYGPGYGFLRVIRPNAIGMPGYTGGVGILGESCDLPTSACAIFGKHPVGLSQARDDAGVRLMIARFTGGEGRLSGALCDHVCAVERATRPSHFTRNAMYRAGADTEFLGNRENALLGPQAILDTLF
jgi:hypothetical protein